MKKSFVAAYIILFLMGAGSGALEGGGEGCTHWLGRGCARATVHVACVQPSVLAWVLV